MIHKINKLLLNENMCLRSTKCFLSNKISFDCSSSVTVKRNQLVDGKKLFFGLIKSQVKGLNSTLTRPETSFI